MINHSILRKIRFSGLFFALVVSMTLLGCGGPPTGKVKGKVTHDNKGVSGALVQFFPESGNPTASFTTQADGSYVADKVPVGKNNVSVYVAEGGGPPASVVKGKKMGPPTGGAGIPEGKNPYANFTKNDFKVDKKYKDAQKSGLSLDVKEGENTFDIDVK